ncbi:MAG: hypothetical protein ACUVS7_00060 [Bryobacteraceae bacterium]
MRCQRCGREISPLRLLTDRDFCSERCRKKGPRASAWFLRDAEYESGPVYVAPGVEENKPQPKNSSGMMAVATVGLIGALVVAKLVFPDDSAARGGPSAVADAAPITSPERNRAEGPRVGETGGLAEWLDSHLPGRRAVRAKVDFETNLGEWAGSTRGWVVKDGVARVGELRLWKATLDTRDYEFEFEGAVERKGMSWVYRAGDTKTYYASRIHILRPGVVSGAVIERYGMEGGQTFARAELPLPLALDRNRPYRIATLVAGSRFTTLIDGKVVDEWSDPRLVKGGVGFFAADGEQAVLHWASFRERKSVWDRFASASLLFAPGIVP